MYIIHELEAQKTLYFARIAENDQKRLILTTNVVGVGTVGYKFDEVAIWLRVVRFLRSTVNASIRDF